MPESRQGLEKLDLLVVADPHPTTWACWRAQERHLSAADLHASSRWRRLAYRLDRSIQWGRADRQAIFESKDDYDVMYMLGQEVRLRRHACSEHQGRERAVSARTSCARSTVAAGRPVIAASHRSA